MGKKNNIPKDVVPGSIYFATDTDTLFIDSLEKRHTLSTNVDIASLKKGDASVAIEENKNLTINNIPFI